MGSNTLTNEEREEFKLRCRAFLDEHATGIHLSAPDPRDNETIALNKAFQGKLAEAGLAGLTYPKEYGCLLYTSPSPRDRQKSRMPSSA